jgi:flavin-dependent dehydrogenase
MDSGSHFDFVIIGGGIAGASLFHRLSSIQGARCVLFEKKKREERFEAARIIVGHAGQYLHEDAPIHDQKIFVRPVKGIGHSSRNSSTIIQGYEEFGEYFGQVVDEQKLIHWFIEKGESLGGICHWDTDVKTISIHDGKATIEVVTSSDTSTINASLVILATGPYASDLQKKMGFAVPDQYKYLVASFHAKPEDIESTFKMDWDYHLNPKISTVGPLQMCRAHDFFNLIMQSDESFDVMEDKLVRIIKNYEKIKYMFSKTFERPENIQASDFRRGKQFKHPIKEFVRDNIVLLGESTGFVTECYNEGFLGALAGSKFLYETIVSILNNKEILSETNKFSQKNLKAYEEKFKSILFKNFQTSSVASEKMFLTSGNYQEEIWDAYITAISKDKKVRKNIHAAWASLELAKYPLENDEYCGEKIFFSLPIGSRVMLTPKFLKMKFSS